MFRISCERTHVSNALNTEVYKCKKRKKEGFINDKFLEFMKSGHFNVKK